jgi:hypothetical protein
MMFVHPVEMPQEQPQWTSTTMATGIGALILPAITDMKEAWYGMEIDKKLYSIVLESETEDSVYLKIVKKPQQEKP